MGTNYRHLIAHLLPAIRPVGGFDIDVSYAIRSYTIISHVFRKDYAFPSLRTMYECLLVILEKIQREMSQTEEQRLKDQLDTITAWSSEDVLAGLKVFQTGDVQGIARIYGRFLRETARRRLTETRNELGL